MFERVQVEQLSAAQFERRFLRPNRPALVVGATDSWRAQHEWVLPHNHRTPQHSNNADGDGGSEVGVRRPNLALLVERFGGCEVPVVNCRKRNQRCEMLLHEYVRWWEQRPACAARPTSDGKSEAASAEPLWYLKDWHFQVEHQSYGAYSTHPFFQQDWLNDFWHHQGCPDHRFVYLGRVKADTPRNHSSHSTEKR